MNITIQATHLDLTEDLRTFVERKLTHCLRPIREMNLDPVSVAIEVERTTHRHPNEREDQRRYRAEANVHVPGRLIRAEASADDIQQAVVGLKHTLTRDLRRWHERELARSRRGARQAKALLSEADVTSIPAPDVVDEWQDVEEALQVRRRQATEAAWQILEDGSEDPRDYV